MKAHQRLIRELHANEFDPLLPVKRKQARSFDNAVVREVDFETAKQIIVRYEWLGNMGSTRYAFGLYFGQYLAGVVCFGTTAGARTAESVCGKDYANRVMVLNRGACVHWAHPHSASFLIRRACHLMTQKGINVFVAYSDVEAGEIGTVYQASNWLYCGTTKRANALFVWSGRPQPNSMKDGHPRDERTISQLTRDRSSGSGPYRARCSRDEMKQQLVREGFVFFTALPKHRYVFFDGDRRTRKLLRASLQWKTLPYPKRPEQAGDDPPCIPNKKRIAIRTKPLALTPLLTKVDISC